MADERKAYVVSTSMRVDCKRNEAYEAFSAACYSVNSPVNNRATGSFKAFIMRTASLIRASSWSPESIMTCSMPMVFSRPIVLMP